jgi:hypothetical protein
MWFVIYIKGHRDNVYVRVTYSLHFEIKTFMCTKFQVEIRNMILLRKCGLTEKVQLKIQYICPGTPYAAHIFHSL